MTATKSKMSQIQIKHAQNRLKAIFRQKNIEAREKVFARIDSQIEAAQQELNKVRSQLKEDEEDTVYDIINEVLTEALAKDKRVALKNPKKKKSLKIITNNYYINDRIVGLSSTAKIEKKLEDLRAKREKIQETVLQPFYDQLEAEKIRVEDEIVLGDCKDALDLLAKFEKIKVTATKVTA